MEQGNGSKEIAGASEEKEKVEVSGIEFNDKIANIYKEYNKIGLFIIMDGPNFTYAYTGIGAGAAADMCKTVNKDLMKKLQL